MEIEFDPSKNARNIQERQLSFEEARFLQWDTALIWQDNRKDYGEVRYNAFALLGDRLHCVCFTFRPNGNIRIISLRKANQREINHYECERNPK